MFGSETLDVIIGLIFVYLICSLVCSAIKEWIAKLLDFRAVDLEKELIKMLDGDVKDKLYNHPFIKAITRHPKWIERIFKRPGRPSYIDSKLFSMALTDILMRAGKTPETKTDTDHESKNHNNSLHQVKAGISNLNKAKGKDNSTPPVTALETIIDSVKAEIEKTENSIAAFREKVENWFNTTMEQLSLWYKRKSRIIIFILAVPLCIGLNIDTIMVTKYLYQNKTAQEKFVEAAIKKIETGNTQKPKGEKKSDQIKQTDTDAALPDNNNEISKDKKVVTAKDNPPPHSNDNATSSKKVENPIHTVKKLQADLVDLGFPVGWNLDVPQKDDIRGMPDGWGWLLKIIGLFISTLAISMGATFWFDILKKLIGFRKSIKKSEDEKKNDSE